MPDEGRGRFYAPKTTMPNTKAKTTATTATTATAVTAETCKEQVIARVSFAHARGKVLAEGLLHIELGGERVIVLDGGTGRNAPTYRALIISNDGGLRSLGAFWNTEGSARPRRGEYDNEQWLYELLQPEEGLALELRGAPGLPDVWEIVASDRPYARVTAAELGW